MQDTIRTNLTVRLEGLITQYPDCPWVKELFECHLKETAKPPVKVIFDNNYVDMKHETFVFEN